MSGQAPVARYEVALCCRGADLPGRAATAPCARSRTLPRLATQSSQHCPATHPQPVSGFFEFCFYVWIEMDAQRRAEPVR